jgi:hypothetical protein
MPPPRWARAASGMRKAAVSRVARRIGVISSFANGRRRRNRLRDPRASQVVRRRPATTTLRPSGPSCRRHRAAAPSRRAASAGGRAASKPERSPRARTFAPGPGDHRGVVGAQPQRRREEGERPPLAARASSAARMAPLAATPPATQRVVAPRVGSAKAAIARPAFSASASATAAWNEAQRSARSARVRPPCAATSLSRRRGAPRSSAPRSSCRSPCGRAAGAGGRSAQGRPRPPRAPPPARPDSRGRGCLAILSKASPGASSMVPPRRG